MLKNFRPCAAAVGSAIAATLGLAIFAAASLHAQTFSVIYAYTGGSGAAHAIGGLVMDRHGNLYGTTAWGGVDTPGNVYELERTSSGFVYNELFASGSGAKGDFPWDAPTFGPNGSLYASMNGGGTSGEGTIVNLQPPASFCRTTSCPWNATDLYNFKRASDGGNPQSGVVFDSHGNMCGAVVNGGSGYGVVYEMTPSGDGWTYQVIYTFTGGADGANPDSPLIIDSAGNLYGAAMSGGQSGCGGFGCGTIYKLSPSGSGWTETTIYSFKDGTDGSAPSGTLVTDSAGNIYGATAGSDANVGGTVFELTPSGGSWTFTLIYDLPGSGAGPFGGVARDSAGNLYGATWGDGAYGQGNVFKLTPTGSGWTFTSLHDFTNGTDGSNAMGAPIVDSNGVVYGTTYDGGAPVCGGCGVVYEVTP
jgi:uncharacterized repeat protein (TIGR03803 family)